MAANDPDFEPADETDLVWACRAGEIPDLEELVDAKIGHPSDALDENGNSCLHMASANGHVHVINLLLSKYKVDVNKKNASGYVARCTPSADRRARTRAHVCSAGLGHRAR
jgi:ankyrin repeat protein